jgi:hypothetical protein
MTTRITAENITDATITTTDLASSIPLNTQWQAVVTASTLNAVAGRGYFINTTSNACTVTLPASPSIGDFVVINDYAGTFDTNAVTISRNGSNINGAAGNGILNTESQTISLTFIDATRGWQTTSNAAPDSIGATFIAATGGTVTTSGDYKIHSFTGDSNFVVASVGNPLGSSAVDYVVVGGGAAGGAGFNNSGNAGGGGGAGGYRESHSTPVSGSYTASPLATPTGITVTAQTYPITVGGGGTGQDKASTSSATPGNGSNSVFATITAAGGGAGQNRGYNTTPQVGLAGGSGGGGTGGFPGGAGNTPPVSPPQGNTGGTATGNTGGGGGGATAVGANAPGPNTAGAGGAGATSGITGSNVARAGGGGSGGSSNGSGATGAAGGAGGGGKGADEDANPGGSVAGTANTGGGSGGGGGSDPGTDTLAGGKGIVIIRYKFQ